MSAPPPIRSWQAVREEVLRRVNRRIWQPGDQIPNEADLAREFGCARATVNRALRSLSDEGLLERRRKGGTRIAQHPVGRATISIPIIRQEIEEGGHRYGYRLIERHLGPGPENVTSAFAAPEGSELLHVVSLHLADDAPYVLEDRWIDPRTVPDSVDQPFDELSANEWLVRHLPFTRADSGFFAMEATQRETAALGGSVGDALIVHRRTTWLGERAITLVELAFARGHVIRSGGF